MSHISARVGAFAKPPGIAARIGARNLQNRRGNEANALE